ncbi:receptor-like protein kinase At3g21340 [Ananas comosus]|uniref:Receptor-like protein kinase At3g21340 n=1 Tax=Ananas comosus TaxID=4615 RepID=A0A6P5FSI6_ANACO|nr:receptor-like protein kinase At3g21340 [Ananas comosus]
MWRIFRRRGGVCGQQGDNEGLLVQTKVRQFTYSQLKIMTGKFKHVIGGGGFGSVYCGRLEDRSRVAVKMRSQRSSQGLKHFLAEVNILSKVYHRNLVSLVGYCMDRDCLALVYEYMAQGSLQDRLRGERGIVNVLTWRVRLQIALEVAKGLEYLHAGCKLPIVHRGVTSSNILLDENLEAKLSDFGLAREFAASSEMQSSVTGVAGTIGYLDPEYMFTGVFSDKSDVYSFGVVLLEIITSQRPYTPGEDAPGGHIVRLVSEMLARGGFHDVVDARLQGNYNIESVSKVIDLAMRCTEEASSRRPTMEQVVAQLKESLELEILPGEGSDYLFSEDNYASQNSDFEQTPIIAR